MIPRLLLLHTILILIEPRTPLHLAIMREGGPSHIGFGQGVAEVDEEVAVELVGEWILFLIHCHHVV
jgi:hypothetical protein